MVHTFWFHIGYYCLGFLDDRSHLLVKDNLSADWQPAMDFLMVYSFYFWSFWFQRCNLYFFFLYCQGLPTSRTTFQLMVSLLWTYFDIFLDDRRGISFSRHLLVKGWTFNWWTACYRLSDDFFFFLIILISKVQSVLFQSDTLAGANIYVFMKNILQFLLHL